MRLEVSLEVRAAEEEQGLADSASTEDSRSVHFVIAQMLQRDEHVAGKRVQ